MTPQEIAALKEAFSESLAPLWQELKAIHGTLGEQGELLREQGELLREQGELLRSIDNRLTNVEGILSGVEILVRKKAG